MKNVLVKNAWEKYISGGEIEKGVRPEIAGSWERCRNAGVDHTDGRGKSVSLAELQEILSENEELLRIAKPTMEGLQQILDGSGYIIVLSDKNCRIIKVMGDEDAMEMAGELNFTPGCLWTEEAVGTNAIGTAFRLGKPVQTIGSEHYCMHQHTWTCSSAVIRDSKGEIIGCFDLSGRSSDAHRHTLGMAVAAAGMIERQMAIFRSYELINITFEGTSDGIIVIDSSYNIDKANSKAAEILGLSAEQLNELDMRLALKDMELDFSSMEPRKVKNYLDCNLYVVEGPVRCSVTLIPRVEAHKVVGAAITFKKIEQLHRTVNKVSGHKAIYDFDAIITGDGKMQEVIRDAKKMALTGGPILVEGESGTGKELFAHSVHKYSSFSKGPFIAINCASIPKDLIESELFGYEKGAFSGASKEGSPGKFELADGGTLFLDEIGEMPLEAQSKLLRVLDNYKVTRIGGKNEKKLNLRIIAATNRNLSEEVKKNNFRQDLYYRLNVLKIDIPPLRERREDIALCANYFLNKLKREHSKSGADSFSDEFLRRIREYTWSGNVRELQNVVERAYYLCDEKTIAEKYLPESILGAAGQNAKVVSLDDVERDNIVSMISESGGNVIAAGEKLGLSKSTIYRKIKKYNIDLKGVS